MAKRKMSPAQKAALAKGRAALVDKLTKGRGKRGEVPYSAAEERRESPAKKRAEKKRGVR